MSKINQPTDILGLALKNLLLPYLDDEKFQKKIKNWNKVIIVALRDFYSITLTFSNGSIEIEYDEKPKYDVKLIVTLNAFVGIAEGKMGLISAFLKREIRVKKIYKIFTMLKLKNIIFPALKRATEQPLIEGLINLL